MKLYVISGLGADFSVLEKITFPPQLKVVFIAWLIPHRDEPLPDYVRRMAEFIDESEPFALLGYSFGGMIVQEINRVKPAQKVIIMGSIRSDAEKSRFIKIGQYTHIPKILPEKLFNTRSATAYAFIRKIIDPRNPGMMKYLRVTDPYYLKWGVQRVSEWKFERNPEVIQILGTKDIVFPIRNSHPDYVVEGGTHLFPLTKHRRVSEILAEIFSDSDVSDKNAKE